MDLAKKTLETLDLEQKVGQLIINRSMTHIDSMEHMLKKGWLGGIGAVVLRKISENDPKKLMDILHKINRISAIAPFLYIDAEKGICDMFGEVGTPFPSQMALGATGQTDMAYAVGHAIAAEAKMLGFDIVSNPVLDVNSNPKNPIIGSRAFGDHPDFVIRFGEKYVEGMQAAHIIPNGKHFPGHGDTAEDSHVQMPTVDHDRDYLENVELKPFRELMKKGMKGIMTAHIAYPALQTGDPAGTPATLSKKIMTDLVRNQWNYDGLVVTDSMTMKAVKDHFGIEQAAVLAFNAGHDMILQDYNSDPMITRQALLKAAKDGTIDAQRIDHAVLKILRLKQWSRTFDRSDVSYETIERLMNMKKHVDLAKNVANKSVTVLQNQAMPIARVNEQKKVLVVATTSDQHVKEALDLASLISERFVHFYRSIQRYCPKAELVTISEDPNAEQIRRVNEKASDFDHVIFVTFVRILSYKQGSGTVPPSQIDLLASLKQKPISLSTVIAGNPYVAGQMPKTENLVLTYCDNVYSLDAAVDILFGQTISSGRLPVTISELYGIGDGL